MPSLNMRVSEDLPTDNIREFVKNFLSRTLPGIRHEFMQNGSLRSKVRIKKDKTSLKISVPDRNYN